MAPGNDVDPPTVDGEGQPEGEEPETTEVDPPALCLFESPQKRARVNGDEEETLKAGAPEFVSVADLYGRIGTHPGAVSIEAIVLFCASEVRWATVTDQRNQNKENVPVLTVVLADRTGYVCLELWRDVAVNICEMAREWGEEASKVTVRVSDFGIGEEKKRFVGKACHLTGDDRTTVKRIASSIQPSLVDETVHLTGSLFVRNLSLLTGTLPFGAHVAGFVSAVGSVSVSRNGNEMLSFRLNDTRGNYVECRACGRHARNKHIEEKNEIVAYGTQAQAGLKGASGLLWVYDESHIVLLRRRGVFSRGTRCIEFRAEP